MWRQSAGEPLLSPLLPDVVEARCVHSRIGGAGCRACVDACPVGAWVIDDERLGIDADLCDGCGLCAPACPEGAVEPQSHPAVYRMAGEVVAFAACHYSGHELSGDGLMPCVHALGVRELLVLHGRGVRRLVLGRAQCDGCPRGQAPRIAASLSSAQRLWRDRGLPPLPSQYLEGAAWRSARDAAAARQGGAALGRRAFFRRAFDGALEGLVRLEDRSGDGVRSFTPPGRLLPATDQSRLCINVPRIDLQRCSGCDACARLCPHQAIMLEPGEKGLQFRLEPDSCTGCGMCRDVCESGAVELECMMPAGPSAIALATARCRACGVDYHVPHSGVGQASLCAVCRKTNHYRNLYQVLD